MISIIPWRDSDQGRKIRLREFRHELNDFDGKTLAEVIEKVRCKRSPKVARQLSAVLIHLQANIAMGIRSGASKHDMTLPMFSDDILKVEISGPDVRGLRRLNNSPG